MGEQYSDLFAAGAYAFDARLLEALAQPSVSWIFYILAGSGIVISIAQSAFEGDGRLWIQHVFIVAVASVLILLPCRFDLSDMTYAAPGVIQRTFGTPIGAAPHLTYLVERFGASVARHLHQLMHARPVLTVPSIAAQIEELTSNPAVLDDPQLKANLEIWRNYVVPRLLSVDPSFAAAVREGNLLSALLNPAPSDEVWVGFHVSHRAAALKAMLSERRIDLRTLVADQSPLIRQITEAAGADPWIASSSSVRIRLTNAAPPTAYRLSGASPAYDDAVSRGGALASEMIQQLPEARDSVEVIYPDQLHDLIGRSILYAAAMHYLHEESRLAALGSYCQRLGEFACHQTQASLIQASTALKVTAVDRYNAASFTTWLKQPLATVLLTVASLLLGALASLVVAVLPFLLGVAKVVAILMSSIGTWMLLWPGRLRDAVSWMVLPVAFVALWSILFSLWADVETFLTAIGGVVSHSDYGSFSASRIMSIAISVGYLGLPMAALSILSGNAFRALNHVGARLETALLLAWRTRHTAMSFGRRWLANSPLARRWNQRVYRSVGLGTLRSARPVPAKKAATRSPRAGNATQPRKKGARGAADG